MKKLAGVGIALVILSGAGSYLYRQMATSPEYSLWKIYTAIEQHDLTSFNQYVDLDGALGSVVDLVIKQTLAKSRPEDPAAEPGQEPAIGPAQLMRPRLIEVGKKAISDAIETGDFGTIKNNDSSSDKMLLGMLKSVGNKQNSFEGIEYVKSDGNTAVVGVNIRQKEKNSDLILELKMRNMGDYWQLAMVNNMADVLQKLEDLKK